MFIKSVGKICQQIFPTNISVAVACRSRTKRQIFQPISSCYISGSHLSSSAIKVQSMASYLETEYGNNSSQSPNIEMEKRNILREWEDEITRSCEDKRQYRYIITTNNMKMLLISDPSTDKSAASLDVHVGSMSDPWDIPGLAHFCEHMLFLGTKKYPNENEYNKYLSEHGGSSNAYTASDHTNFYFDVAPDAFQGALDRFAQFFSAPLFTESCMDREVNAVHSEHEKNLLHDYWRMNQLEKSTSKREHPYIKFGTGSKETLLKDGRCVREEMLAFQTKWYAPQLMGLVVLGKESLDALEQSVVPLFSEVAERPDTAIDEWYSEHPFTYDERGVRANIVPVKDIRNLHITWPLSEMRQHYKTAPTHYVGHLIGHEGKGSLLSYLKDKGWVNSLLGGQKSGARGFSFFCVNVDLTEEGIEHVDDIIIAVFQYLALLRTAGPQRWVFDELQVLGDIAFRFKDKERPQSYVTALAESLYYYPPDHVLTGNYVLTDYDPQLIEKVLGYLVPQTTRLAVVGKQLADKATETERWYGTQYGLETVTDEMVERWTNAGHNPALSLPKPNQFIPQTLQLCEKTEGVHTFPERILETPMVTLWFKQDTEYKLPKSNMCAELFSPVAYQDPLTTNLLHMFAQLFRDDLTEYSYDAELAGLDYSLNNSKFGLTLSVRGYYDKQTVLLKNIMDKLVNFKVDHKRFEILKDTYVRALCNFSADQPHQHVAYYTSLLLSQHAWAKEDLLAAAREELTVSALESFIPVFLSRLHCEMLVHGSVSRDWALALAGLITEPLQAISRPVLPQQRCRQREVMLSPGSSSSYEAEHSVHSSSAIEVLYQGGQQSTAHNALFELTAQILHEPAYDELRTKEQLGYIVWSGVRRSNGTQGFRVIVQSPHSPEYLDGRVEAFMHKMESDIRDMSEEDYLRHREALIQRRLETPKKMASLTARWWTEIASNQYNFDRETVEVDHLRTVTKDQLLDHYLHYLSPSSGKRAKMSVQVLSSAAGGAASDTGPPLPDQEGLLPPPTLKQASSVQSVVNFKSSLPLFPLMQPFVGVTAAVDATESKAKL